MSPIIKTSRGYHIANTKSYFPTYRGALNQLRAIKASQARVAGHRIPRR